MQPKMMVIIIKTGIPQRRYKVSFYNLLLSDLRKAVIGNEISLASIPFLHDRTIERVRKLTEFGVLG